MGLRRVFSKDADRIVISHFTPRLITATLTSASVTPGSYLPVNGRIAIKSPVDVIISLNSSPATSRLKAGEVLWIDSASVATVIFPDNNELNIELM